MEIGSVASVWDKMLEIADEDAVDLKEIASFVKSYSDKSAPLVEPNNTAVRICGQDGTVYAGNKMQLKAWKEFYLPKRMEMEVIGAIDDFPCDAFGLQLVLLLYEDGKIYAYEDKVLHLVAKNVKTLVRKGMHFPGTKTFEYGKCFKEPTEETYKKIMESEEMKTMREPHQKFREYIDLLLLNALDEIQQRTDALHVQQQNDSEDITSDTEQEVQKEDADNRFTPSGLLPSPSLGSLSVEGSDGKTVGLTNHRKRQKQQQLKICRGSYVCVRKQRRWPNRSQVTKARSMQDLLCSHPLFSCGALKGSKETISKVTGVAGLHF